MTPLPALPAFTPARFASIEAARDRVFCADPFCGIMRVSSRATNTEDVSRHYVGMATMPQYTTRNCPVCNKEYQADVGRLKYGRQTTCSRECSYTYRQRARACVTENQPTNAHCGYCNKAIKKHPHVINGTRHGLVFCSTVCYHSARSEGLLGINPRRGPDLICATCGNTFYRDNRSAKYCSRKCFEAAHKLHMRGENNPSYIDGRAYNKRSYRGASWDDIRKSVYERDNYSCQRCGVKCLPKDRAGKHNSQRVIQCHHIEPYRISKNNALSNLITLCLHCHLIVEQGGDLCI